MVGRALSSGGGNLRAEGGTPKIRGRDLFGGVGFSLVGVATRLGGSLKQEEAGPVERGGDNVIRGGPCGAGRARDSHASPC